MIEHRSMYKCDACGAATALRLEPARVGCLQPGCTGTLRFGGVKPSAPHPRAGVAVLYRRGVVSHEEDHDEWLVMEEQGIFRCESRLDLIDRGGVVVPRYALHPHEAELIGDIERLGAQPINDLAATRFARDTLAWTRALGAALTPPAVYWNDYVRFIGRDHAFLGNHDPVVLKVGDRSRKERWRTHMFARDKVAAIDVMIRLLESGADADQIVVRPYRALRALIDARDEQPMEDAMGCPVAHEYRVFVVDGRVATRGFYWMPYVDDTRDVIDAALVPQSLLDDAINRIAAECPTLRFYALDVAERDDHRWMVVEINDGCQSGTAGCDVARLYEALARVERRPRP